MKSIYKTLLKGCFVALALSGLVEFGGYLLLARAGGEVSSLVPVEVYSEKDFRTKWEILTAAIEVEPAAGYQLTNADIERVKELILIAEKFGPEEHEGHDGVNKSSAAIQLLAKVYPEIAAMTENRGQDVYLHQVRSVLVKEPVQLWRVVWATMADLF